MRAYIDERVARLRRKKEKVNSLLDQVIEDVDTKDEGFDTAWRLWREAKSYGVESERVEKVRVYVENKEQEMRKINEILRKIEQSSPANSSSYSQSSRRTHRYIVDAGYSVQNKPNDSVWFQNGIKLSDGSRVYANLRVSDRAMNCWTLTVSDSGSHYALGHCSSCGSVKNRSWRCKASGYGTFTVQGDYTEALRAIVRKSE
jgi:hypothetical protein